MPVHTLTDADTAMARRLWAEYQELHDTSGREGQVVGIDPDSGQVWFGDSALDVIQRMRSQGTDVALYFVRVGCDYYVRKGGRQ